MGTGLILADHSGGRLAVGGVVAHNGVVGHIDDLLPTGFVLVCRDAKTLSTLPEDLRQAFEALGGVCVTFGPGGNVADCQGVYLRWFDEINVDVALIRPDFYLFGAMKGRDGAERLVAALTSMIEQSPAVVA